MRSFYFFSALAGFAAIPWDCAQPTASGLVDLAVSGISPVPTSARVPQNAILEFSKRQEADQICGFIDGQSCTTSHRVSVKYNPANISSPTLSL